MLHIVANAPISLSEVVGSDVVLFQCQFNLSLSEYLERAKRIFDVQDQNDDNCRQERGFVLSGLGSTYRFLGRFQEAEKLLEQALEIFQSLENPSKLRVGMVPAS